MFCSTKQDDIHLHFQLLVGFSVLCPRKAQRKITAIIENHFIVKVKGAATAAAAVGAAGAATAEKALIAKLCNCNCNDFWAFDVTVTHTIAGS